MPSSDVVTVYNGMGDKVATSLQWVSAFFSGVVLCLYRGWELTLVILTVAPAIALVGGVSGKVRHSTLIACFYTDQGQTRFSCNSDAMGRVFWFDIMQWDSSVLFLIYLNDISNTSNLFKFILFADDTSLLNAYTQSIYQMLTSYKIMTWQISMNGQQSIGYQSDEN